MIVSVRLISLPPSLQGQLSGDELVVESPLSLVDGARARFGNAVAFLGDIDNDGYNGTSTNTDYIPYSGLFSYGGRIRIFRII